LNFSNESKGNEVRPYKRFDQVCKRLILIKDFRANKRLGNEAAVERRHGSSSPRKSHTLQGNSPKPTGEAYSSLETMNKLKFDQL
jgi:hypothetical protein